MKKKKLNLISLSSSSFTCGGVLQLLPRLFMMEWPFRTFTGTIRGFCIKSLDKIEKEKVRMSQLLVPTILDFSKVQISLGHPN